MKKYLPILILLVFFGCKKTEPETFADFISAVSIAPTDNALRFKVNIDKKKDCTPVLEVRAKGTESWKAMPGRTAMFLYPETEYEYRVCVGELIGEVQSFTSGSIPEGVPTYQLVIDNGGPTEGYLLQMQPSTPGYLTVCDMWGKVLWYEVFDDGIRCAQYDPKQGRMAVLEGFQEADSSSQIKQLRRAKHVYLIDWEGNRYLEWDASEETGKYPHHEIRLLPNGNIILNSGITKTFDLTAIGGTEDHPVCGDEIIELTQEKKIVFRWDVFQGLDLIADASWLHTLEKAQDIVHQNSIDKDTDGNYYVTHHWTTEIWKIDGKTGTVLYKLGPHGNVTLDGEFANGGFHSIVVLEPDRFLVNNNGNTAKTPTHALVYKVDSQSLTATIDMDVVCTTEYASTTGGNVELLPDGKTLYMNSTQSKSNIFMDKDGTILRVIKRPATSYRAFYFPTLP